AAIGGASLLAQDPISAGTASAVRSFELEETSIAQLQEAMSSGRLGARQIAEMYLARIEEVDSPRGSVGLNAMMELNPDAIAIADQRDRERKEGFLRGPLHGIPIIIKDNIDTADRMRTSAGSLALAESIAKDDAYIVRRMREAGAVLLGKTNLSEWANFRSTRSTSGWSARGGQTHNPYVLTRNPCGSSAGTGAAVAASLAAAGIGTETDGSVVCPSTSNGLVGLKPTLGLVSRSGIIPIAHSQDTAGTMTRTVSDAAILLSVITGIDARDPLTLASRTRRQHDYTKFLDANGLEGARIGVARQFFGFNPHVDQVMNDAIEVIRGLGATVIDPANIETHGQFNASEYEVLLYEFKADLNAYLAGIDSKIPHRTLADLIRFNEENKDREMPFFGQEIFLMAEEKGPLTDRSYRDALAKNLRLTRKEGIDATLAKHGVDALISPTGSPAWPTDLINGDHFTGGYSSASAVSGYPHITVPAGFVHELPVGLSFFAGAWSEPNLIRYAYAFEQATRARKAPRFIQGTVGRG
ncbi:MAG TPA: amidase, partial [Thermoanaerobaculia bacterium]|nr:amidase [Thermoanaerobaculia bacterium]